MAQARLTKTKSGGYEHKDGPHRFTIKAKSKKAGGRRTGTDGWIVKHTGPNKFNLQHVNDKNREVGEFGTLDECRQFIGGIVRMYP